MIPNKFHLLTLLLSNQIISTTRYRTYSADLKPDIRFHVINFYYLLANTLSSVVIALQ